MRRHADADPPPPTPPPPPPPKKNTFSSTDVSKSQTTDRGSNLSTQNDEGIPVPTGFYTCCGGQIVHNSENNSTA